MIGIRGGGRRGRGEERILAAVIGGVPARTARWSGWTNRRQRRGVCCCCDFGRIYGWLLGHKLRKVRVLGE
jgi:hypothetical protein